MHHEDDTRPTKRATTIPKKRLLTMVHKPARRTIGDMAEIRQAILDAVATDSPTTCRSIFYRLVSAGAIPKTEAAYKGTVIRLLTSMRRSGELDWNAITDGSRLVHRARSHRSLDDALEQTRLTYRRALWRDQPVYVEVWSEKDAMRGVIWDVTSEWDVPLYVCKGYPSQTYLHNAAMHLRAQRKPAFIYYLGDHDPSGVDIPRHVERLLREYAPGVDLTFVRLAVTRAQIVELELQTRPTKATDSRSRSFEGESVEVDAIPPNVTRTIVRGAIEQHVDDDELAATLAVEAAERETLDRVISQWRTAS
jgi:hypothetical protein